MKKIILTTSSVLIISLSAFAQGGFLGTATNVPDASNNVIPVPKQELSYEIRGSYARAVTKTTLDKSLKLNDFIDGYPGSWIDDYVSVSIITINNGKETKATGTDNNLTAEQKNNLQTADLNADVDINIKYIAVKTLSSIGSDKIDENAVKTINTRLTIIPETEAKYPGGAKEMNSYLKANIISKIPELVALKIKGAKVLFTINDKGEVDEVIVLKSSGDEKTDQLMKQAINNMPKWKPAENAKGAKVKQYFEFTAGVYGC